MLRILWNAVSQMIQHLCICLFVPVPLFCSLLNTSHQAKIIRSQAHWLDYLKTTCFVPVCVWSWVCINCHSSHLASAIYKSAHLGSLNMCLFHCWWIECQHRQRPEISFGSRQDRGLKTMRSVCVMVLQIVIILIRCCCYSASDFYAFYKVSHL